MAPYGKDDTVRLRPGAMAPPRLPAEAPAQAPTQARGRARILWVALGGLLLLGTAGAFVLLRPAPAPPVQAPPASAPVAAGSHP